MNQVKRLYLQTIGSIFLLIAFFIGYVVKFYPTNFLLNNFDNFFIQIIQKITPAATNFYKSITFLGNPEFLTGLSIIFFIIFILKKYYLEALYLVINMVIVAGIGNQLLKILYRRPRPTLIDHIVEAHGFSFPSGHAMGSMLLYGSLALFGLYFFKNNKLLKYLNLFLFVLPLLIGCSRIYLGVHYPSDVLAGWLFGFSWLSLTYPIYRHLRFIHDFKQTRR